MFNTENKIIVNILELLLDSIKLSILVTKKITLIYSNLKLS